MLTFGHVVREDFNVKTFKDRRKKVNRIVISYLDEHNNEYRKSFEFPKDMPLEKCYNQIPKTLIR